ncbi:carboxymuconolactone decarboxylase family protein [Halosolutus amylolyticus]|uniref:Carboxymuconolactone decarboxylase family protein n=1 Tax=Halosolutus amylolyticus TaxID=2932267 RepID=A0ABD5PTJ6_9EURY|nr:carboxymuconolactone decarboxylase family protein [Halosolutus amylolyticus]
MSATGRSPGDFQKKTFTIRSLATGIVRFVHNVPRLVRAKRADRVSDQFAEKIMLAVTAVNDCQYCTRYHTDLARETGVDGETIARILENDVDAAVDDTELPALLFAQQYAETDEKPGREAVMALRDAYGRETAADVLAFVRAIYFGNLLGNTYDGVRFALARRAKAGRRGLQDAASRIGRAVERLRERCPV